MLSVRYFRERYLFNGLPKELRSLPFIDSVYDDLF